MTTTKRDELRERVNTHNMVVDFGKHKGEYWTRIPASYLRWLVNQPDNLPEFADHKKYAQSELDRRGTKIESGVEITPHAIDTASLRIRKIWHEDRSENEGLYTWLTRVANEAIESVSGKPEKIKYKGIHFIFKQGNIFPILKTVTR